MMKQRCNGRWWAAKVLILAGLIVVPLFQTGAVLAAKAAPRVALTETRFDFGTVFEDRELIHPFAIQNTGNAPLQILDVDPDCACTVAAYDRKIPPGGEGEIILRIRPFSVLRQFRKEAKVRTNDPEHPEFDLVLTGTAMPFIEITPSHIVRLRGSPGDNLQGEVRFTSHLPGPFKITSYQTNIPDKIDISLKTVQPDRVYVLDVKNKVQNTGPYAGLIELNTSSKERPRLIVRVFGEIYLPSASHQ